MANYTIRYRLQDPPRATVDGSTCVTHDIWAESMDLDDPEAEWAAIGGRHKTIAIPCSVLAAVLASGTIGEKVQAYKDALADNLNTLPLPISGWGKDALIALLTANAQAAVVAQLAGEFILEIKPDGYPVYFML